MRHLGQNRPLAGASGDDFGSIFNRHDRTDSAASVLFVPLGSIHRSPLWNLY